MVKLLPAVDGNPRHRRYLVQVFENGQEIAMELFDEKRKKKPGAKKTLPMGPFQLLFAILGATAAILVMQGGALPAALGAALGAGVGSLIDRMTSSHQ